ncbi:MAG TPA: sulfite exporter TauE/SafE family protein [Usitatibacter sp.]|nr:sulfite exporter TauE/SafE family protein [Usitatibacter sp.]
MIAGLADTSFLVCALAVMAGALIQSTGGIGFAMFAAPIVAIVRPDMVPGPMILVGGMVSLLIAIREFRNIDVRGAAIAVGGRIPGSLVAGLVIGLLPRTAFGIFFAVLILAAVALSVSGWRVRATPASLAVAGFSSGVMGTITSVGAPPMGIVMQNMHPATLRATLGAFIFLGGGVSLAVLAHAGRFGAHEIRLGLLLIVPMALGFWISTPLVRHVNAGRMRGLVLGLTALSAAILLVQSVRQLAVA